MLFVFATSSMHYEVPDLGIRGVDFPCVSITGRQCKLMCLHCYGKLLNNMIPVSDPNDLKSLADDLKKIGGNGVLISGGCDEEGRVPFEGYLDAIKHLKELGLKVFIHTGVVDDFRAKLLEQVGVDAVLVDCVVSEAAIRGVIGLNDVEAYVRSLRILTKHKLNVVPHVVIGINRGMPSDEFKAIDLLSELRPKAVVFVIFTPYPDTPLELASPPQPNYVIEVLKYSRFKLADVPVTLGCMRPRSPEYLQVEIMAIELGFNGVAFPSIEALDYIVRNGLKFKVVNECCASIFSYVN
ncbi:MAG: radical SAM protein [Candidatus Nezhaarchaeota archaeon]|nr:radical SAM protein [Candidatus Nezhaarchaeota archaeon]MCX8141240.1 radical SAM protein [Candidatus Nezhaarchaeota archaeon]MDW8049506.1 radical SAM protein [Nitrososphaerota archaeon]